MLDGTISPANTTEVSKIADTVLPATGCVIRSAGSGNGEGVGIGAGVDGGVGVGPGVGGGPGAGVGVGGVGWLTRTVTGCDIVVLPNWSMPTA
jgi:hypothetical protein